MRESCNDGTRICKKKEKNCLPKTISCRVGQGVEYKPTESPAPEVSHNSVDDFSDPDCKYLLDNCRVCSVTIRLKYGFSLHIVNCAL